MALAEDAASVLEQFVQDVANLPAEIAHLLEEIQAKDRVIQECRSAVNTRDTNIQKFLKSNGAGQPNPKEETYIKNVTANYDKAQIIQEEKIGLSEKAATLLDRQIKRLDLKIRDLQNEGAIQIDPQLPSLLNPSTHRLPSLSTPSTTASTPLPSLQTTNLPAGPSTTIANNNPLARLVAPSTNTPRPTSPVATTPTTNLGTTQRSSSSDASKRRRLQNGHLSVPPAGSSALRQSSLGPNTQKPASAQQASRGSSAGPRPSTKKPLRGTAPPHQRVSTLNPTRKLSASQTRVRHRLNRKSGLSQNTKASASDRENSVSEVDGAADVDDGDGDVEMVEEDEGVEGEADDMSKYCTCRNVSFGNMIACDNDECPYEWFHWSCVGMTREPAGKWYCSECKEKMGMGS